MQYKIHISKKKKVYMPGQTKIFFFKKERKMAIPENLH